MYNNVGLSTARGAGTNAYVQSNANKIVYNAEEDIARAEAEVNKASNWSCWIPNING
uniref:Uncharacterized protein n=1 Tax=Meloidogyne enterolobii TaxID=390850 RepID=A0A6V7YAL3_MELEN|nr:unnamed protein product [Meloidogyne enterolobii]